MTTRPIAQELALSEETVRNYVKHILAKLGVHSRIEAVAVLKTIALR
jgi:DNA-binding NarL/FixJ family response regulator